MNDSPGQPAQDNPPIVQPLCAIFRRFLKKRGLKFTAERAAILDAVLEKDGVFEVDELLFEMHQAGHRVSKATIYRTIKHLVEAGIIQEVLLDSKQAHYQLIYGRKPMDHLVCVETGKVIEFFDPAIIKLRDRIAEEHGFNPAGHRFLIYGISPEAREGASGR
jgi:Fur family ferric uptake transcriptional regulator